MKSGAEAARRESILAVDDTPENLRLLVAYLKSQGYTVRLATTGARALSSVERDPPDLVLLDINMPGMDGYEVCRRLQTLEPARDVPVIFVSAFNETMDKVRAFSAGGVDYVTKPFQLEEVGARIETHLDLRRTRARLQESYQRLQELEKLRDGLVHMVVHDMTSPLTALGTHVELLRRMLGEAPGEDVAHFLDLFEQGVTRLIRMTENLLDVSRLEAEKLPLDLADCDLAELVHDAARGATAQFLGASVQVDAHGPLSVRCDADLVRRVVENLVSNGLKHNPAGGTIEVGVRAEPGAARVTVRDHGAGIPPEYHESIFAKFGTLEARKQRKYHSTGLGLAFCRMAIDAHGGAIGVESAEGRGSTFWFTLPRP
jgi:signal transduction histidine kinase